MKTFTVVYEDNHLLIVNKPAGMLSQGDETGDKSLVDVAKDYIKTKFNKPGAVFLGLVHRLDRPVSGLVILARTSKALERMNAQFRNKETQKVYWALVTNAPPVEEGTLTHWLVKDKNRNQTTAFDIQKPGAQHAILHYKTLAIEKGVCLVEVRPITGRPHQIRVQLASMGSPIIGDIKYGAQRPNDDASICLHARQLTFLHPVQRTPLRLLAPIPDMGLWKYFLKLDLG
jgi:23S rRNA pseudouridine1911/1915/1917 synthase